MRILKNISIIAATILLFLSCNLDSSQGIYQRAYNDTPDNYQRIQTVLGEFGGNIYIYANTDIYSISTTDASSTSPVALKFEAEFTTYNMRGGYVPFYAADNHIYFSYIEKGVYKFFRATIDEINNGNISDATFRQNNAVTVTVPNQGTANITSFSAMTTFTLGDAEVLYTLSSDNPAGTIPNNRITHYGYIYNVNDKSIEIRGGASVHMSSSIIGHRVLRTYVEDSDIEDSTGRLDDVIHLYILNSDGDDVYWSYTSTNNIDYDDLPIGSDGDFYITLEGALYRLGGTGTSGTRTYISNVAPDLIYRNNTLMPLYSNGTQRIGYLYEEGIYYNNTSSTDTNPSIFSISDNNDLITSCWLGHRDVAGGTGTQYLMLTQMNGFWVITINENGTGGSIAEYIPSRHGRISEYTANISIT